MTYSAEDILIHYVKGSNGLVTLVVAEDVAGRRMPFAFLHELQKKVRRRIDWPIAATHG